MQETSFFAFHFPHSQSFLEPEKSKGNNSNITKLQFCKTLSLSLFLFLSHVTHTHTHTHTHTVSLSLFLFLSHITHTQLISFMKIKIRFFLKPKKYRWAKNLRLDLLGNFVIILLMPVSLSISVPFCVYLSSIFFFLYYYYFYFSLYPWYRLTLLNWIPLSCKTMTYVQTDTYANRQIYKQTDIQTDRYTHRHKIKQT
jgi:hypothetical protein